MDRGRPQRLAPPRRKPADAGEAGSAQGPLPAAGGRGGRRPTASPAKGRPLPLAPIERRLKRELARGRGAIDGALDLHGMNQAEAHQALRGFLRYSQARGAKLVIVVTGKGGPLGEPMFGDERGRAAPPDAALAARAGPALDRARLRRGRPRPRRRRRALRASQTSAVMRSASLTVWQRRRDFKGR